MNAHKYNEQAVADEQTRRAASRQTCFKQRRTLSVLNFGDRTKLATLATVDVFELGLYIELFVESRQF